MRDRDVRNAIQEALVATGEFDEVSLAGVPETWGSGASDLAAAFIEPATEQDTTRWDDAQDGDMIVTSVAKITFAARNSDAQLCDEAVERLHNIAANALNGTSLADLTMPAMTRFQSATWLKRTAPERRIETRFSYQYLVSGWNAFDTTV